MDFADLPPSVQDYLNELGKEGLFRTNGKEAPLVAYTRCVRCLSDQMALVRWTINPLPDSPEVSTLCRGCRKTTGSYLQWLPPEDARRRFSGRWGFGFRIVREPADAMVLDQIAQWMIGEIEREGQLRQRHAIETIRAKFGSQYSYANRQGNWAIAENVLRAFAKKRSPRIVWDRDEYLWYMRGIGEPR